MNSSSPPLTSSIPTFNPWIDIVALYARQHGSEQVMDDSNKPSPGLVRLHRLQLANDNTPVCVPVYRLSQEHRDITQFFPSKIVYDDEMDDFILIYYVSDLINPKPFIDEDVYCFWLPLSVSLRYDGRANIYLSQIEMGDVGWVNFFVVAGADFEFLRRPVDQEEQ